MARAAAAAMLLRQRVDSADDARHAITDDVRLS